MLQYDNRICKGGICYYHSLFCRLFCNKILVMRQLTITDQSRRLYLPFTKCSMTLQTNQAIWRVVFNRYAASRKNRQTLCTDCLTFITNPFLYLTICQHILHRLHWNRPHETVLMKFRIYVSLPVNHIK